MIFPQSYIATVVTPMWLVYQECSGWFSDTDCWSVASITCVSHMTAADDLTGLLSRVDWLVFFSALQCCRELTRSLMSESALCNNWCLHVTSMADFRRSMLLFRQRFVFVFLVAVRLLAGICRCLLFQPRDHDADQSLFLGKRVVTVADFNVHGGSDT